HAESPKDISRTHEVSVERQASPAYRTRWSRDNDHFVRAPTGSVHLDTVPTRVDYYHYSHPVVVRSFNERSMSHLTPKLAVAVFALVVAAAPVFAQTATSSITGVVIDDAGGVVPGANVSVKSESTGAESRTVTSTTGAFTVPALNVGTYTVTVALQGFKTAV